MHLTLDVVGCCSGKAEARQSGAGGVSEAKYQASSQVVHLVTCDYVGSTHERDGEGNKFALLLNQLLISHSLVVGFVVLNVLAQCAHCYRLLLNISLNETITVRG